MKITLLLPLLAMSFGTIHAKDVFRGKNGGRTRALQDEFSLPSDLSVAGIVVPTSEPTFFGSECPGVTSKSGKIAKKGDEYCLDEYCGRCVGLRTLFEEKGCFDLVIDDPLDECYTLPALEELALDQIPKCALLFLYGVLGGCVDSPIAVAESESASGGTLFGIKMDDVNVFIRANLPANFAF
jgi:hypothetical protein